MEGNGGTTQAAVDPWQAYYASPNEETASALAERYDPLVIAERYRIVSKPSWCTDEELDEQGRIALTIAIVEWNSAKGTFASFAMQQIAAAMREWIRDQRELRRKPKQPLAVAAPAAPVPMQPAIAAAKAAPAPVSPPRREREVRTRVPKPKKVRVARVLSLCLDEFRLLLMLHVLQAQSLLPIDTSDECLAPAVLTLATRLYALSSLADYGVVSVDEGVCDLRDDQWSTVSSELFASLRRPALERNRSHTTLLPNCFPGLKVPFEVPVNIGEVAALLARDANVQLVLPDNSES